MVAKKPTVRKRTSKKIGKKPNARRRIPKDQKVSGLCFTIMPYGGWFDDYYETVFRPAIEATGLIPRRADDLYRPSAIVNDIWNYTKDARLILADLSGKNPNVFYELGLAHALAKPAILVVESMEDVPFDLRALRILEYDKNDPNWGIDLLERIKASIFEVLDAPAHSVLPTFLDTVEDNKKTTVTEDEKELLNIRQEIESLKRTVLERPHPSLHVRISRIEAEEAIERYVQRDMPINLIRRRLIERGAPSDWVDRKINALENQPERAPAPRIRLRERPSPTKASASAKKPTAKKKK